MSVDTHGLEVLRRSAEEITPGNAQELLLRTSTEPNYSFVSTDNSSSAILNNGQTYTGSWENTAGFSTVAFSVKTDQSGSLYADFSVDGVNVDSTLTYTVEASTNEVHRLTITKQYFRLRFTNSSGSNQTYFRLQSILGNHPLLTSSLSSQITGDSDSIVTRSILYGEQENGEC